MQVRADKVSLLGQARRRFLGLSTSEASFAVRGFRASEDEARRRLEQIGIVFLSGYHAALEETGFVPLARRLATVETDLRGFAFEGAAMGLALLDCFTPWRKDRWRTFTARLGEPHIYMMHVGLGWALARLRRSVTSHLAQLDPLLGWLAVDGYGFHEGYFNWPRYVEKRELPARLENYERRVFDQGLGRSIWFVKGADVASVAMRSTPSLPHDAMIFGVVWAWPARMPVAAGVRQSNHCGALLIGTCLRLLKVWPLPLRHASAQQISTFIQKTSAV